jgi:hypothetical protein
VVVHVDIVSSPPGSAGGIFSYQSLNPSPGVARELARRPQSARSPG